MKHGFYLLGLICALALGVLTSGGNSSALSTAKVGDAPTRADPPAYLLALEPG